MFTYDILTLFICNIFRVEGAHAKLKRFLGSSLGNFETNWGKIHALLELQQTEIKASFEKSLNVVLHNFKPSQFKNLRGLVSIAALTKIVEESNRINSIGVDAIACRCILRRTYGLPCAHELAEYSRINQPIPLDIIDSYWRKLDITPLVSIDREVEDDLSKRWTEEVEIINQQFSRSNTTEKLVLLKRLKEINNPTTTFLIEPEVKLRKRGKRIKHNEVSTRRLPCAHELVENEHVNIPAINKSARRQKEQV